MHPRPEFEPTLFLSGAFQTMDSWRVNIIAASYGTPAAYRLAHLWPDRITRIVLGGTMRKIPHHVRDKVQQTVETALKGDRQRLAPQVIDGLLCRDPFLAVQRRRVAERASQRA